MAIAAFLSEIEYYRELSESEHTGNIPNWSGLGILCMGMATCGHHHCGFFVSLVRIVLVRLVGTWTQQPAADNETSETEILKFWSTLADPTPPKP